MSFAGSRRWLVGHLAVSLGAEHVPHLLLDTGVGMRRAPSAPKGRANTAQASGLGDEVHPVRVSQALKRRDKGQPSSLGEQLRASHNAISPFQGLLPKEARFPDPGPWPGLC